MLRDVAHRRRATAPRADARPAAPAPSRQPARDPLLDRARRDGLGAPVRRAGGLAGRRARRAGRGWALLFAAPGVWLVAAPADGRWQALALALTAVLAAAHLTVMPR